MKIGLIGLPYSGKTTIFEAIIKQEIDPGHPSLQKNKYIPYIVNIEDVRIDYLNSIYQPKKKVPATIEFVDFMGIAEKADFKGFDTQLLTGFKLMDGFVMILRGFSNDGQKIHPQRDMETLLAEFLISDQIIIENRLERLEGQLRKNPLQELKDEQQALLRCLKNIEQSIPLRKVELSEYELKLLKGFQFLTLKPMQIVINISDDEWQQKPEITSYIDAETLKEYPAFIVAGQIEKEITFMDENDRNLFLEEYAISEPVMQRMIKSAFDLLDRICFFTVGEDEVRAWPIDRMNTAQKAAGAIHSDIERGFIRAEVVHYEDFIACGHSMVHAKEKGLWRLEGKEYLVKDGDIINFRFSV